MKQQMNEKKIRWNLESIYPSLESPEYRAHKEELTAISRDILHKIAAFAAPSGDRNTDRVPWLMEMLHSFARLQDLQDQLESYVAALWSVDTGNNDIQRELNSLETLSLEAKDALVQFRAVLKDFETVWESVSSQCPSPYWLERQRVLGSRQMSPPEEALAADLQRSGADAWERLHGKLSSQITRDWDAERKTLTELRAMAYNPDRQIRRQAWKQETALLKDVEITFASALNGVKGACETLNRRRGWGSTLEKSLFQNNLSHQTLDVLLGAMTQSLPIFRRYLRVKARHLGLEKLSWYDVFAPLGKNHKTWSWEEVEDFIPRMFSSFSAPMGEFARRAFAHRWIDVPPREGKVGGAYCTDFPLVKESRILCNFDGSFDSVCTVAHELGHAWHSEIMKDIFSLDRDYPMIFAECASTFAEILIFETALEEAPHQEQIALLDTSLMSLNQVITDILSRFIFESELMRRRAEAELSPAQLCRMMLDAQEKTYGDALNPDERHPWMWAVKGHYYSADLAFYNFPYAFGQLFSLALFARFRNEGKGFAENYSEILRHSGCEDAAALAARSGFDINSMDFWLNGMSMISAFVDRYEQLDSP